MEYIFTPDFKVIGSYTPTATIEEIAQEVGMYSASPAFVRDHGGRLTNEILDQVPQDWFEEAKELGLYPNIDVRVHRLYTGDFPAVPGWHCDGEFRKDYQSQPELSKIPTHRHIVGTLSTSTTGVSLTEFVTDSIEVDINEDSDAEQGVWEQVHNYIEDAKPTTAQAEDGNLYDFSSYTLHRATPAKERGWRLFLRASMWHKPYLNGEGTLARQEFVYRVSEAKGW